MKILVIEDNDGMQIVVRKKLEMLRVKFPDALVSIAGTMAGARDYIAQLGCPDLCFIDAQLPDSDIASSILEALRIEENAPVIIMTGYPEEARRLLGESPVEVLAKDEDMLRGSRLFEFAYRALFRHRNRDRLRDNIQWMREFIDSHNAPA